MVSISDSTTENLCIKCRQRQVDGDLPWCSRCILVHGVDRLIAELAKSPSQLLVTSAKLAEISIRLRDPTTGIEAQTAMIRTGLGEYQKKPDPANLAALVRRLPNLRNPLATALDIAIAASETIVNYGQQTIPAKWLLAGYSQEDADVVGEQLAVYTDKYKQKREEFQKMLPSIVQVLNSSCATCYEALETKRRKNRNETGR